MGATRGIAKLPRPPGSYEQERPEIELLAHRPVDISSKAGSVWTGKFIGSWLSDVGHAVLQLARTAGGVPLIKNWASVPVRLMLERCGMFIGSAASFLAWGALSDGPSCFPDVLNVPLGKRESMNKRSALSDGGVAPKGRLRGLTAALLWIALAAGSLVDLMAPALGAAEPSGMCLFAALGSGMASHSAIVRTSCHVMLACAAFALAKIASAIGARAYHLSNPLRETVPVLSLVGFVAGGPREAPCKRASDGQHDRRQEARTSGGTCREWP